MQAALSALLASVAGHYAKLAPSDVGIGLTGGRLAVSDVQLRPESLESPALPFRIVSGRAGVLRVNVPWGALSSSPVTVYIENVELVAGPRDGGDDQLSDNSQTPPPPVPQLPDEQKWHQTRIGRVLFNMQVEIIGLQLEYRDYDCVARVQAKALRAHSVDQMWRAAFVPLEIDTNGAVAMRKLISVEALRMVMVPLNERGSFEEKRPMLRDVNAMLRVLVCAAEHGDDSETDGVHTEIDVELDDPVISVSKRQMNWMQSILDETSRFSPTPSTGERTPRRLRTPVSVAGYSSTSALTPRTLPVHDHDSAPPLVAETPDNGNATGHTNGQLVPNESFAEHDDDEATSLLSEDEQYGKKRAPIKSSTLLSLWNAIVSENSDETVDDAAYALGLRSVVAEQEEAHEEDEIPLDERSSLDGSDELDLRDISEQFAKRAVEHAAGAGGLTLRMRLRTPDQRAWARVKELQSELEEEREFRAGLEDVDATLREAKERVARAELNANELREKNEALQRELHELEELTAKAGRNKDAVIRQTEAALTKAESHIQELLKEKQKLSEDSNRIARWRRNRVESSETVVVTYDTDDEPSTNVDDSVVGESEADDEENKPERMHADEVALERTDGAEVESTGEETNALSTAELEEQDLATAAEETEEWAGGGDARRAVNNEMEIRDIIEKQLQSPTPLVPNVAKTVHDSYAEDGLTLL